MLWRFVVAVSIRVVWDVFSESHLGFRVSVVGGGGFPSRAGSVRGRIVGCISVGNVSFDFLQCVIEFHKDRVSVGGAGGFLRAESVGMRVERGFISLGNVSFDFP